MAGFTPFKRRANQFNYKPRYFDPKREERKQRRAELLGKRSDEEVVSGEYTPGDMLRTQFAARKGSRSRRSVKYNTLYLVGGIAILLLLFAQLYPKIAEVFTAEPSQQEVAIDEYEEFDPYAPIVIVPNDYVE